MGREANSAQSWDDGIADLVTYNIVSYFILYIYMTVSAKTHLVRTSMCEIEKMCYKENFMQRLIKQLLRKEVFN